MEPYIILESRSIPVLQEKVRGLLAEGYEPCGGPFLYFEMICQAMIKRQFGHIA